MTEIAKKKFEILDYTQSDNFTIDGLADKLNELTDLHISVCTCPMESTDVYDDSGKYLGYVCLGCGYFSKY